ncbi:hypothetical protein AVEN_208717-1 [Araneus ventricosus]|uniref:Uncharacterized protein n=1 Tax=Araneus ventricosus TaxID=182803 RepID=A0A4Y2KED9_ARAVE|nr:hypothetical protein AVEN_208717-1 [Araneus ventricosus]
MPQGRDISSAEMNVLKHFRGPQWPAKKVSASEPEEYRLETRFHQSSEFILAWLTPGLRSKIKRFPAAVEGCLCMECRLRRRPRHLTKAQI